MGLWDKLRWAMRGKELIGSDKFGNRYFLRSVDGRMTRRAVEYHNVNNPDPKSLPVLWGQWLAMTREMPPTDEEIEKFEKQQEQYLRRVQVVEEKEKKLRRQERAQARLDEAAGNSGSRPHDMSVDGFLKGLNSQFLENKKEEK
eukprot:TRINITY_DN36421_c0_g1_i1.p2 TRINITY_DN36421_c0_g1~~TRINITY_DN36421_c0_g1_i1.p2  ORF type:complete len:144 (+),score=36.12 TRINITY_DN36421_c0_g1_i1:200-631(+)